MVHALLGEHRNVVGLLLERLEALRDPGCDLPRVVVLSGSAGSGKTRIVQELYARLRSDREDAYWPVMGDVVRTRGGAGTDPMAGRKVVAPRIDGFVWPAGTLPTFGWWGLSCERLATGNSQDVVSAMRSQLEAHTVPLVMARRQVEGFKDKARRLAGETVNEVRSAFVDEGLSAAFEALKRHHISIPLGPTLVKWCFKGVDASWRRMQELNHLKRDFLLGEQGSGMQRAASQQLADMLISLSCRDLPAVVAIEDMHLMGRELPAFLDVVSSRRSSPVLVVGTVWPEGENNGAYRRWLNKAQSRGVVQHVKSPVLGVNDLSRMIQEEAPRTSEADLLQVTDRLNNPYLIRLWLTENRTREHIAGHGGAVVLADENVRLPEDIMAVLKARWDELDDAVRNGVLYAAAISPDVGGSACRFVSEVVAGVVNRREPEAHYNVRMGLRRAIEKLCWCRSEQGVDFFVDPLLVEYLKFKTDSYFGKEECCQLRLLTQGALAEWICRRVDGIDLPPSEVSTFVSKWFLDLDDGDRTETSVIARAAAQWRLAQNAGSCDEVGDAVERGKKTLAALLVGNPLSEKATLNVRATVSDYILRGGVVKDALNRYSALLPAFERAFGIYHPRTLLVRYGRAKAMASLGRVEDGVEELRSLLEDQSAVLGGGHPDTCLTRSKLIELLNVVGCVGESLALCCDDEIATKEMSGTSDLLFSGLLKACTLMGAEREIEAVDVCRDLLRDMEGRFGPDHDNVLEARSNLAAALRRGGLVGEAVEEYRLLVQGYGRVLGPDHPHSLAVRVGLGVVLLEAGLAGEAVDVLQSLLTDKLRFLSFVHPEVLYIRHYLAWSLEESGDLSQSLEVYGLLIADEVAQLGLDHPATMSTRGNYAGVLGNVGRMSDCIEAYRSLLSDSIRVLGRDHPSTLKTGSNLAWALGEMKMFDEGIELGRIVLRGSVRVLGVEHPDTLAVEDNLAWSLGQVGNFDEAIRICHKVISGRIRVLGPDHPDTLKARDNYAGVLGNAGMFGDAIKVYQGVLNDRTRVLGSTHPNTLTTRNNYGGVLEDLKMLDKAIKVYQSGVTDSLSSLGSTHPITKRFQYDLASTLAQAGRVAEAVCLYRTIFEDESCDVRADIFDVMAAYNDYAVALVRVGLPEEAVDICRMVVDARTRMQGAGHFDTLTSRDSLGVALLKDGRLEESIVTLQVVLGDKERLLGSWHQSTELTRGNLAEAFIVAGRFDEAVPVYQSILEARLSSADPDDPDVLDARDDLAWALGRAKRFDEALAGYMKLIVDYERVMGVDDPDTLTARNNYICTLKNSGKIMEAVALYRELLSDVERILGADDEFAQEIAQRLSEWES